MTYIPPSGRINATIAGNTAGVGSLVSTGTLSLAGGNNITLSQNGNGITISGANAPSGSINFSAGNGASANLASVEFLNSNGVNFGLGGSVITASVATNYAASNHSHGNPTLNLTNLSGSTASASNGLTLSLSAPAQSNLSATGAVSLASNGNTISIGAPAFSAGIATNSTVSNQVIFSAGNNITLSQSTNPSGATIAIHGTSGGGGVALANSQTTYSTGTANLLEGSGAITIGSDTGQRFNISVPQASSISATGAVSISTSGNTISIGAPNQTNQTLGMYGVSNTTQSTFGTADARSLSFHGAGGVSVGISNGSVVVSGGAGGGGSGGVALSGAGGSITSGTASVVGGGALSASFNGQTLNLNAPATSMLSAGDGISISTTGSTVVFQAAPSTGGTSSAPLTLSRWEYPINIFTAIGAPVINSMSLQRVLVPFNVSGQSMRVGAAFTVSNITSLTTANVNISLQLGIYTLSGSTLSRVSSGSTLNSFSWSASSQSSQFNSLRQLTAPINVNMVPGEYWVGAILSSASTYAGATMSMYGNDRIVGTGAMGNFGSHISSSARDVILGQGLFATASLPASVAISAIVNTGTQAMRAGIYHAIYNATY